MSPTHKQVDVSCRVVVCFADGQQTITIYNIEKFMDFFFL